MNANTPSEQHCSYCGLLKPGEPHVPACPYQARTSNEQLPTWEACADKRNSGKPLTALEEFIFDNEPARNPRSTEEEDFRTQLLAVSIEQRTAPETTGRTEAEELLHDLTFEHRDSGKWDRARDRAVAYFKNRPALEPTPPHPGPSIEKAFTNSPRRIPPGHMCNTHGNWNCSECCPPVNGSDDETISNNEKRS
jgi:hypothetical protein